MSDVDLSADLKVSTKVPTTAQLSAAGLVQLPDPVTIAKTNKWEVRDWDPTTETFPEAPATETEPRPVLYASKNYTQPNVPPVVTPPNPPPANNPTYMITYVGNGNTGGLDPIDPTKYGKGTATSILGFYTLVKTGFKFVDWNTEADGSGTSYAVGAGITVMTNVTLYAQWTPVVDPEVNGYLGDNELGADVVG